MSELWENFFKAEIRSSGAKLVAQEKVALAGGSDTAVDAYVRVSPPVKVRLSSADISSDTISCSCTCPTSKKGQFCKHVWAVLLCAEVKYPDFFIGKRVLDKATPSIDSQAEKQNAYQASAKLRASEYRKAEYQRQKLRAKELKNPKAVKSYPQDVETAIAYFTLNGFPMSEGLSETLLGEAKRKLSRVFHPDKGGSHDEVVELNNNCEVIARYLRG